MAGYPVLCFSTLGCTELDLEDALALAARYGLSAIELRGLGGTLDMPAYLEKRFGSPARFAECVKDSGVAVVAMDSSVDIIGAGPADRKEIDALWPWVAAVGAPRIRVFDGGETASDAELASIGELLGWWSAKDTTIALMIETHDALAQPEALQRCRDLYPAATLLWDTHHTWHKGGEAPARTWTRLAGAAPHLHVKDSVADGPGIRNVPPGQGDFPHADLIAALVASGFDGVVSLEWERHWHPDLPTIETALDGFVSVYGALVRGAKQEAGHG